MAFSNKYPTPGLNFQQQPRYYGEASDTDAMHCPRMYVSPTAPSVSNDNRDADGIGIVFQRSDFWHETTDGVLYLCEDPTNAAADWQCVTHNVGTKLVDETDIALGSFPWYNTTTEKFEYGVRWEDLRAPLSAVKLGGVNDPAFVQFKTDGAGSTGVYVYAFNEAAENEAFIAMQFPHSWKIASDIYPHIHWCPTNTDTGAVVWGLEYTWASVGGTYGNTTKIIVADPADGTSGKHQLADFDPITAAAISGVSSMLLMRLYRNATAAADTYDTAAAMLEFDIHYQIDSVGSTTELAK